ncbi:MAG: hypothetical protein WC117_08200 [Sphaerochaetaceae bacterium]|nr:hypothetical protein [Sphaerochaetaceae bacterium]MDD3163523.1 hypothetical protein [Sphaerochaetaceae bacterium]
MKKLIDYCKSDEFESQFGDEAESFRKEAEEALNLVVQKADKKELAAVIEKMKATAKKAGSKAILVLLDAVKID